MKTIRDEVAMNKPKDDFEKLMNEWASGVAPNARRWRAERLSPGIIELTLEQNLGAGEGFLRLTLRIDATINVGLAIKEATRQLGSAVNRHTAVSREARFMERYSKALRIGMF
jgi:hypothetical protein